MQCKFIKIMKTLIVLMFVLVGFTQCGETEEVNPQMDSMSASVLDVANYSKYDGAANGRSSCFLTNDFTARLYTTSGARILPANVQPNTNYSIRVRVNGSYVCCENPSYCITSPFGFSITSGNPKDAINGDVDFTIRTNAALVPGIGIIGIVQAVGCNGTLPCGDQNATSVQPIT